MWYCNSFHLVPKNAVLHVINLPPHVTQSLIFSIHFYYCTKFSFLPIVLFLVLCDRPHSIASVLLLLCRHTV